MNIYEAIENRHSVRNYKDTPIEEQVLETLRTEIDNCNQAQDLAIQLIANDHDVFKGLMAHYGGFRNVSNYIALIGPKSTLLHEKLGYYGEHIALYAQQLGLQTCWVALTYKKGKCKAIIKENQELVCILAIGHGTSQGVPHKSKTMKQVSDFNTETPQNFIHGIEAALLAPTAMNKQNFKIRLVNGEVRFEVKNAKYSNIDLGIIKYHFHIGYNRK